MDYAIKCYSKFSGGYVYKINNKTREIWADNMEDLKRKVSAKNLLQNDSNVPKVKVVKIK